MPRRRIPELPPELVEGADRGNRHTVYLRSCPGGRHAACIFWRGGRWRAACTGGCGEARILRAVGLPGDALRPAPVARYPYQGAGGEVLFTVERYWPKRFRTVGAARPGHLYRLPELLRADPAEPVFWVEGEKDVESLRGLGLIATTSSAGAYSFDPVQVGWLHDRHVIVIPDNDPPGEAYAKQVASALEGVAASVRVLRLNVPPKGDVSVWLAQGGSRARLLAMAGFPAPAEVAAAPRLGSVERTILRRLLRARYGNPTEVTTDGLPAAVFGLPAVATFNARTGTILWRYPEADPCELRRARASISRALRSLIEKGLIRRDERRLRLLSEKRSAMLTERRNGA